MSACDVLQAANVTAVSTPRSRNVAKFQIKKKKVWSPFSDNPVFECVCKACTADFCKRVVLNWNSLELYVFESNVFRTLNLDGYPSATRKNGTYFPGQCVDFILPCCQVHQCLRSFPCRVIRKNLVVIKTVGPCLPFSSCLYEQVPLVVDGHLQLVPL
jgi:hypothetical protein